MGDKKTDTQELEKAPCVCEGEERYPGHWDYGWLYDHYICAACKGAQVTPNFAKEKQEKNSASLAPRR